MTSFRSDSLFSGTSSNAVGGQAQCGVLCWSKNGGGHLEDSPGNTEMAWHPELGKTALRVYY
jgi:hypothetical protein